MKARQNRFVKPSPLGARPRLLATLAVCAGGAALLGGCAATPFAAAPVNPDSPIAAEVAAAAKRKADFPSFHDIPKPPTDQRPVAAWGQAAGDTEDAGRRLERETAPGTWSLEGTETFSGKAQAEIGRDAGAVTGADTEAFARAARERATPPPSPR